MILLHILEKLFDMRPEAEKGVRLMRLLATEIDVYINH